jgi:capsule polysaccharide export protein KpsE/RkpR
VDTLDTLDIRLTLADRIDAQITDLEDELIGIDSQISDLEMRRGDIEDAIVALYRRQDKIRDVPDAEVERIVAKIEMVEPTEAMRDLAAKTKSCQTWDEWADLNRRYAAAVAVAIEQQAAEALERALR